MSGRVAVVGSLNADLVVRTPRLPRPGETVTGSDLLVAPGGKSANQAAAAAKLGGVVTLVGRVGDDAYGRLLRTRLRAAGVDTTRVEVLASVPTGTALIAVDDDGENLIVLSPGANARLAAADVRACADVITGADVLCLCLEVGLETVTAAAVLAADAGVPVVLNLSPSRAVDRDLLSLVEVLVVNRHELADLVGGDVVGDAAEPRWRGVLAALRDAGPRHVVVTLGAAGAVVLAVRAGGEDAVTRVPAPAVVAVDTTGCGDAFFGALCRCLADGDDLPAAVRLAVRVGAYAATGHGAQDSYPRLSDLEDHRF